MNVIVIGAGFSGLAAAWRLTKAGLEVSVLERTARPGGRVGYETRGEFGLDATLETLHAGDRHLLGWIRELGLAEALLPLRPLQLAQPQRGRVSPIDPQSLGGVASIPGVRVRDAGRLLRWSRLMSRYAPQLDPTAPERAAALDFRSVSDFVRLYFGDSTFARWVAPEVTDAFSDDPAQLSRVTALQLWCARRTGKHSGVSHGALRRPLGLVAETAAERLPVRFEVEATRVDEVPAGGFAVECSGGSGGRGTLEADAVVLATGGVEAGRLLGRVATAAERDYLVSVEHGPEVVLSAALSSPPSGIAQRIRVPACEDLPIESVLLEPGQAGCRAPAGAGTLVARASCRFAEANAGTAPEVIEKGLRAGIERLLPAVAASIEHTSLHRTPAAIPRFRVGAYRALERFRRVQEDRRALGRRIYFAGDHLIAPSAEGSVVSGLRAAHDLVTDLARD